MNLIQQPIPMFQDHLPKDKKLFHYTDASGLAGMIQGQQIWMTSIHYQNDFQEYFYTFNLVKEILSTDFPGLLTEQEMNAIGGKKTSGVFTFSLSEKDDSLSQWRGYSPNGGYALSFDKDQLDLIMKQNQLMIGRCIYNKKDQRKIVIEHIIKIDPVEFIKIKNSTVDVRNHYGKEIVFLMREVYHRTISTIAPFLKHPKFSAEKEWRLIKNLTGAMESPNLSSIVLNHNYSYPTNSCVKIRPRKNLLIPYIDVSLKNDKGEAIRIDKIMVGPNPHKELAKDACRTLLYSDVRSNYREDIVYSSDIPYVNW